MRKGFFRAIWDLVKERARVESLSVMNQRIFYRTSDGMSDYGFSFERQATGGYLAFITHMPSYGTRDRGIAVTHRLTDSSGRYYVCWDRPVYSVEELKQVVALWSDLTQVYIRTGRAINEQL